MGLLRASGADLIVRGEAAEYVIEPARFERKLTRVQMVDAHLRTLVVEGKARSRDVDILLDVRSACRFVESYTDSGPDTGSPTRQGG